MANNKRTRKDASIPSPTPVSSNASVASRKPNPKPKRISDKIDELQASLAEHMSSQQLERVAEGITGLINELKEQMSTVRSSATMEVTVSKQMLEEIKDTLNNAIKGSNTELVRALTQTIDGFEMRQQEILEKHRELFKEIAEYRRELKALHNGFNTATKTNTGTTDADAGISPPVTNTGKENQQSAGGCGCNKNKYTSSIKSTRVRFSQ